MSEERLTRISNVRKRAAPTGTAFDFIRVHVPCPECRKEGLQPLAELAVNDSDPCPYCGAIIDLGADGDRAKIGKLSEELEKIEFIQRG